MSEESVDIPKLNPNSSPRKGAISRRTFLRVAGGAAATTAAGVIVSPDAQTVLASLAKITAESKPQLPAQPPIDESKEIISLTPRITMIDAVSGSKSDEMLARAMGRTYLPEKQLTEEFGEDYKEHWDKIVARYPQALFMQFADGMSYQKHGEKVSQVMHDMWQKDGQTNAQLEIKPLQDILDASSITYTVNKKGDEGIEINFDPQKIITMLKDNSSKVVNGSFQIGEVGVFKHVKSELRDIAHQEYPLSDDEGNVYPGAVKVPVPDSGQPYLDENDNAVAPISKAEYDRQRIAQGKAEEITTTSVYLEGAYTKDKALQTLPKVFEVCNAYPDTLFVFAAGNEKEDLRQAREQLKDSWPNNVLFVGQWTKEEQGEFTYEGPKYSVQGADIYVNNEAFGKDAEKRQIIPDGSSFSTPVISAKAAELFAKGDTLEQVKEKLFAQTRTVEIQPDESTYEVKVFEPEQ